MKASTHAQAAKLIRAELKKAFPLVKFSVSSHSFAGGTSIHVEWNNGPLTANVGKITGKYQYGHFDGMYDIYEHSNSIEGLPQVKYVQHRRAISESIMLEAFEHFKTHYAGWEELTSIDQCSQEFLNQWSHWTPREFIYRQLAQQDLTHGFSK